ncbi:hypothetical protein LTS17_011692 [Exophiala oligosperma]
MKFGQDFEAALSREEFPQEWINSAISYKKLKKCIKRVQQELASLGLDKETLDALWQHVGSGDTEIGGSLGERLMQYSVDGSEKVSFTPRLTIVIDPRDGSPMDAWLAPDTRRVLQRLARNSRASVSGPSRRDDSSPAQPRVADGSLQDNTAQDPAFQNADVMSEEDELQPQTIEIPLTSDSEFFQILKRELADLDRLQDSEQTQLQEEILKLGAQLRDLKSEKTKRSKQEIEIWRKIFELYAEAEIFMSSHEADAGARDAERAQLQYSNFNQSLKKQQKEVRRLGKDASAALERFLGINSNLIRLIKFQEINKTALSKIMKKFDKRTALHARSTVSDTLIKSPFMAQNLAKATCFTISQELLNIIPQLNDYLCPVCFNISYKPIRLKCGHIFCIRCMVVMQREEKDHCPLCRQPVVLEASSANVDRELLKFMKANFKSEVKAKQRDNEIQAGIDRWGAQYENSKKCNVM